MAGTLVSSEITGYAKWSWSDAGPPQLQSNDATSKVGTLAAGTGANAANLITTKKTTIAPSANLDIDLAGGVTDPGGVTINFAKVRGIYIELLTDTAASGIAIGPAPANGVSGWFNAAGDRIILKNGGALILINPTLAGNPVTAATADLLRITNQDGAVTATIRYSFLGE